MSFKYFLFNMLLCFVILLLGIKNYEAWNHPVESLADTGIVREESEPKNENPPIMASAKEPTSLQPYKLISEKNLFSPERKEFPIVGVGVTEGKKPVVRPQIILCGVAVAEDYQSAIISNPGSPLQKEGRQTQTVRIGENIGEYKVVKILPDRIAMESSGDAFEVLMFDPKRLKKRVEVGGETEAAMSPSPQPTVIAAPQPVPGPPSGETAKPGPSQVLAQIPTQGGPSLPFNKYTYRLSLSSGKQ